MAQAKKKTKAPPSAFQNRIIGYGEESPDQLLANPRNARIHPLTQQEGLTAILERVGWVTPIIVNKRTGFVVDGHLRVAVSITREEPSIPVAYVDLDDDEEALILATLDPLAGFAATDRELLANLMADLEDEEGAVRRLLDDIGKNEGLADAPAEFPAVDEDIQTEHECPKCGYKFSGGK